MAESWFVVPETIRLPLEGEQWIDVKRALNVGEVQAMFRRIYPTAKAGEKLDVDLTQVGSAKVLAYLVGWSLVDPGGKPVAVSEAALNRLSPEKFALIREAIEAHDEAAEAQRAEEKNGQAGVSASSLN